MFLTAHPLPPEDDDYLHRGDPQEDAYAFLRETATAAIASGQLRPEFTDAEALSQLCWASAHGVVALQNVKGSDTWVDWRDVRTTAYQLLDATLRGLVREPSRARLTNAPRAQTRKKSSARR
jgi:hypothetical protein